MATEAQWIDVNVALPEAWTNVLVQRTQAGQHLGERIPYDIQVAYLYRDHSGGKEFRSDMSGAQKIPASHWMPLPAPPTAARKGE